jgi:hypothetical protein
VNDVVAVEAPAPLPAEFVRAAVAAVFLAAGFLAGADAAGPPFLAGAAFLAAAGAAFLEAGALLAVEVGFLAVDRAGFLAAVDVAFLAAVDVVFLVAVAAFFTGAAFFFVRTGRFVAVAPTLDRADLFPDCDLPAEAADPGADTLLTWVPLLAGVIVPSFGPGDVAPFPAATSPGERVTIAERARAGNTAVSARE